MNYLDLVNNVLRRLREDTVASVGQNDYSLMVGDIVNDAKRQVEDSWDWSALRTTFTVPTVQSTSTYSLTGTGNRATILDARNTTNGNWMVHKSQQWGRDYGLATAVEGVPAYYSVEGVDSNGDTQVKIYATPDGVYSLEFALVQREDDLSAEGDEMAIPHMPVIYLAYAMAARESGEAGGAAASELFGVAKRMLADAIAQDSAFNPTDLVFYEV